MFSCSWSRNSGNSIGLFIIFLPVLVGNKSFLIRIDDEFSLKKFFKHKAKIVLMIKFWKFQRKIVEKLNN